MLNELYELATSLTTAGVQTASWHRHFKPNPNSSPQSPAYFIRIAADGKVMDIEPVSDRARVCALRKWEVENGVSFPSFNVVPLYKVVDGEEERKLALELKKQLLSAGPPDISARQERLEQLVRKGEKLWSGSKAERISKCLKVLPEQVAARIGKPPAEYKAIEELIHRVTQLDAATLFERIAECLCLAMIRNPECARYFFDLLFFYPKSSKVKLKTHTVILELADQSAFAYPANNKLVQQWMNESFLASEARVPGGSGTDAYGQPLAGWEETFPACRLSVLGNVILRAMSSESPCQYRYGFVDARSYPVGREARKAMKAGLEWLAAPERKGRTWSDVSGGNQGRPTVLFAYPSLLRAAPPHIAGLFANSGDTEDPDGFMFAACAERITTALQGSGYEQAATDVRVFVLEKTDKARTKVICHGRYHVRHLLQAAQEWQSASRNVPEIRVRQVKAAPGSSLIWERPLIPFPMEVVWCLNSVWQRQGTRVELAHGFSIEDGVNLLLGNDSGQQTRASLALALLLRNSASLLVAMAHAHHQSKAHAVPKKYEKQMLLLPSLLGLLLAKAGSMKGVFMHQSHFLIGRLLSLSDQLHEQYCQKVRKGSVPSQLVGNALMPAVLEQPTHALAILSQRILPYQAWAKSCQGEEARLSKFFLGEMGRVSQELATHTLPIHCDDNEKAQLLLGYLAWSGKSERGNEVQQNDVA